MSFCPKCGASVSLYDTAGNPWYACGSAKTFRSASCVDREPVATQLRQAQDRIKQLEEELMEVNSKHSVLVADVVLNEDRAERIKQLEDRIRRASIAFFNDGSDASVASGMLAILEEERGKK